MALFESYERRIDKINGVLKQNGIDSVEQCREICQAKGFYPDEICLLYTSLILSENYERAIGRRLIP